MNRQIFPWLMAVFLTLVFAGCSEVPEAETPEYETDLTEEEAEKLSAFEDYFPHQYETYMETQVQDFDMDRGQMTEFAGNVPHAKHLCEDLPDGYKYCQPYLKNLWLGYGFSFEYNRARGHGNAMHDLLDIDRTSDYGDSAGMPATCYNCKSNKVPGYVEEYGDDFWAMEFNEFREDHDLEEHAIGCNLCHEPETMDLRLTSVPLKDYLDRQDTSFEEASRSEQRSLVCGQCHSEYYFEVPGEQARPSRYFGEGEEGVPAKPVFPWDEGYDAGEMYNFKKHVGDSEREGFEGWFVDWTHPVSDTPMLKVQHPEYEMWEDGPHGSADVACADCHMPYTRMDGKKKISSHNVTSPLHSLETVQQTCGQCHADKAPRDLKDRVIYTQEKVFEQLLIAQEESVRAHEAVRLASEYEGEVRDDFDELMIQARERIRKGQWFWDYVSAENSEGFHNPQKSLETLSKSQQYSRQAQDYAKQATNYGIAEELEGDIKEIVPPIEEHSRKLMMSEEHLQTHDWFEYLDVAPEEPRTWELNEKVAD